MDQTQRRAVMNVGEEAAADSCSKVCLFPGARLPRVIGEALGGR